MAYKLPCVIFLLFEFRRELDCWKILEEERQDLLMLSSYLRARKTIRNLIEITQWDSLLCFHSITAIKLESTWSFRALSVFNDLIIQILSLYSIFCAVKYYLYGEHSKLCCKIVKFANKFYCHFIFAGYTRNYFIYLQLLGKYTSHNNNLIILFQWSAIYLSFC